MGELGSHRTMVGCPKWGFGGSREALTPTRCPGSICYTLANIKPVHRDPSGPPPRQQGRGLSRKELRWGLGSGAFALELAEG